MKKTYILYIPGLGDGYDGSRQFFLKFWKLYGVTVEFVSSGWGDGGDFESKMKRVIDAAKSAHNAGYRVVLLGESAGGSLALNTYSEIPDYVDRVVTLCGKNTRPSTVSPRFYRRNPAFQTSMAQVDQAVTRLTPAQRREITTIYPLIDSYVPRADTVVPDCRQVRMYSVGHLTSILFGLTIGSSIVVREATR